MLPTDTTKSARRARLFELLRQQGLAELTAERLQDPIHVEETTETAQQVKADALKSFETPPVRMSA